jgi:FixJ family two-component response regulator
MQKPPTDLPLVCVVDDDPSVGRSLARLLRSYDITPQLYTSPQLLLAEDSYVEANCLIVDIHMPRMNGYELADRVAETAPELPIIFISAQAEESDRWESRSSSAIALLVKPFSAEDLNTALAVALDRES